MTKDSIKRRRQRSSGQIHKSLKERAYIDKFIKWECLNIFIDKNGERAGRKSGQ